MSFTKLKYYAIIIFIIILTYGSLCVYGENTTIALEDGDSNITFYDDYKGYCIDWGKESAEQNQLFQVQDTSNVTNKVTDENVSNHLKVMFLYYYNQTQKDVYATQHMIWKFTDNKQFSRFNQSWYDEIITTSNQINVPDNGFVELNYTHNFYYSFKIFTPFNDSFQNFFAYKFFIKESPTNSTIEVNNSTINNSTVIMPNINNNSSIIQYNNNSTINWNKNIEGYTLNETGYKLWILFCIVILLMIILILKII